MGFSRLVGSGPRTAGRQAAALFALAGVLAAAGVGLMPDRSGVLLTIAGTDLVVALVAWWLPWDRWGWWGPYALALPAYAVLGLSTWAFGGFAAGTGPFFLLIFAWAGLNFPPAAVAWMTPAALAAYMMPLLVTAQPPPVVASGLILVPTALGIGLLIAHQVQHQRRDRERIAQIERWRAGLTAALAHDLRSPLTTMQLVLEALEADGEAIPAARREAMLAAALRQVGRISRLASGLLDVDRVDTEGSLKLDLDDVPLQEVVTDSLALIDARGVVVEVDPDLVVSADRQRLEQILVNLTSNALRYGRPPVVIRARPGGGVARIEVRDHGPGVSETVEKRLFSRFSGGGSGQSVGLGLWIVRQLAEAHGGSVHYEAADPGARIVVTLPLGRVAAGSAVG
jgi:signal transduction histidine kinase